MLKFTLKQGFEGQTLVNIKHLWDSFLCKQACIGFEIKRENNVLMLCLSQGRSS
jgi:hypothetical protein